MCNSPDEIDYIPICINNAIIVDNTGDVADEEGLGLHREIKGCS